MFFTDKLPHLKVYRQKAYLPYDQKAASMYGVVFVNGNSTESVIDLINSKNLDNNSKYHFYYFNNSYRGTLFSRAYHEKVNKERDEIAAKVKKETGINIEKNFNSLNGRSYYFDMQKYNEIFFRMSKKTLTFKTKVSAYLDMLKDILEYGGGSPYKNKLMVIDVDTWITTSVKDTLQVTKTHDSPIFILYYAAYRMLDELKELGDIDIVFHSDKQLLRMNPSQMEKDSYRVMKEELSKFRPEIGTDLNDDVVEKTVSRQEMYSSVIKKFSEKYNFTGENSEEFEDSMKDKIDEIVNSEDSKDLDAKALEDKLAEEVMRDEKVLKTAFAATQKDKVGKSAFSLKRDQELREKQKSIKMGNMTIEQLQKALTDTVVIEQKDISSKITTTNKNVTTVKYPQFEKAYNDHLMEKDLINMVTFLNEKSIPVYVRSINVEDTSNELNLKKTYTIELEDGNRVRHKLKFDMPVFIDDKFMYLGGNKKIIIKQLFMKPVVKTGPDEVQICSNYNKIFIRRHGNKVSSKIEKFKKAVAEMKNTATFSVKYGNNSVANNTFKTTIEYDELAKAFTYMKVANCEFYFNQEEVQKIVSERGIKLKSDDLCVGFYTANVQPKDSAIIVNTETQTIGGDMDIIDYILSLQEGKIVDAYEDASAGKKFMYSRATIMAKQVPIVLLLGYLEGLTTVLRKAGIKHQFSDTRPKVDRNQGYVQFANGYLIYDKYPFENSLLMNAFADIPTKGFDYEEFDQKDAYMTIFDSMYGSKIIGNAFYNFYEFMIDPITREVLEDLNYPTDFVSLVLFANSLLGDNSFIKENNMNLYRVRSNELVNAFLYKAISDAYIQYRLTANNNNPVKISVPQDAVLKKILTAQTVEDYSILNPIVELEKSRAITPKGHVGLNLDQAYTQEKRSYDPTMLGLLAMSTSPDANCGIVRQLTMEPNIKSPRGYLELNDDNLEELKDANLFSPAELLSPLGVTRDDSIRTAMATKQSKHIIPIEKSSPVLISNGVEGAIHYHLSDDFSIVAKGDGKVVEVNEQLGIIMVEYDAVKGKPKQYKAIDINPRVVKNGAGGFYLSNKMTCDLKLNQRFKKDDILAYDSKFFTDSEIDGNRFNIGSLQKVAIMSNYATYEDSTFITKKLSEDMAADIVMQKSVVLGKNANIDHLVKIGDQVTVGDELLSFEISFEDDSLNKFLSSIGDSLKEEIKTLGKTKVKSKYTGIIEDIKIYSTVDLEELSPSLQKIVGSYYNGINKKKKMLNKYEQGDSSYKCGVLINEPTGKIETKDGKVKGNEVGEGVLIEIYIKYRDIMGVGDKVTFFTALKSIIGEVVPEGYEPSSEFRPEEEVSSFIAPGAILARMTPSILLTAAGNKVLVELKRSLQEIYTGKPWEPTKK